MKKFNYKDIIKKYLLYKKIAKRENDPEKSLSYSNKANWYRYILEISTARNKRPEYDDLIADDLSFLHSFNCYSPYIQLLAQSRITPTKKYEDNNVHFSESKLAFETRRFYEKVSKKYHSNIFAAMMDNNSYIKVTYSKKGKMFGEVIPSFEDNSFFINMKLDGTLQDYLTFVHEFGHVNALTMNKKHFDYAKTCLFEADTLFMEMVALDDIYDCYRETADNYTIDSFNEYVYAAKIASAKMSMLCEADVDDISYKPSIVNFLEKEGYEPEVIKDILYCSLEENFKYGIAYMIAIELYYKYKNNKEEAIGVLNAIINLKDKSEKEYLDALSDLGIKLGQHLDEYEALVNERYNHGKGL